MLVSGCVCMLMVVMVGLLVNSVSLFGMMLVRIMCVVLLVSVVSVVIVLIVLVLIMIVRLLGFIVVFFVVCRLIDSGLMIVFLVNDMLLGSWYVNVVGCMMNGVR